MSIGDAVEHIVHEAEELCGEIFLDRRRHRHHGLELSISLRFDSITVKGNRMSASLNTAQQVSLTAGYVDSGGNVPTTLPPGDVFTWSIDTSGFATLSDTTGTTVNLVAQAAGTGTVTLTDSAGLPAATLTYTVTEDAAVGLTITVGTPGPKS